MVEIEWSYVLLYKIDALNLANLLDWAQAETRLPKLLDWAPAETYLAKLQDWAPAETHPATISFILLENCRGFAPAIFNGTPGNWVHP